jgi:hypothetical protein
VLPESGAATAAMVVKAETKVEMVAAGLEVAAKVESK